MTVVNLKTREAKIEHDEERKILSRYNHGEISQYDAAVALAKLGYSINNAWRIARSAT